MCLLALLILAVGYGCIGQELAEDGSDGPAIAVVSQAISPNAGSTIPKSSEGVTFTGAFPEVMLVSSSGLGCTGTVIGPYTVLTAAHCVAGPNAGGSVLWSGSSLAISYIHVNPYINETYAPDWWIALNNAQKATPGGRQDDWPAMHDHAVLFVPDLTPQFIANNRLQPAHVFPANRVTSSTISVVGVASTGGVARDYYPTAFVPATPGSIVGTGTRDGYLTRNGGPNLGHADPGDSGGPSEWREIFSWPGGADYVAQRFVVSTAQNPWDTAPFAYNPGMTMTANQLLAARLNSVWAQARMDDADGDGLPTACDSNPALATGSTNRCPAQVGGPSGTATREKPVGQLECKPGYLAAGIRGRYGALIDQLAVKCRALSCYASTATSCADEYWTDPFGGEGGAAFTSECPAKSVLRAIHGTSDSNLLYSLGYTCASLTQVAAGLVTSPVVVAAVGGVSSGTSFSRDCGTNKALAGFQTRTTDKRWVTGLQPICTSEAAGYKPYVGGNGGLTTALKCPTGQLAIGAVHRPEGGAINVFGLICAPQATVMAGQTVPSSSKTVAHGYFMYFAHGVLGAPMVEPLDSAHLPAGFGTTQCQTGFALNSVSGFASTIHNQVSTLVCRDIRPARFGSQTLSPSVGTAAGTAFTQSCGLGMAIDGLYMRTGWFVDGLSLHCRLL